MISDYLQSTKEAPLSSQQPTTQRSAVRLTGTTRLFGRSLMTEAGYKASMSQPVTRQHRCTLNSKYSTFYHIITAEQWLAHPPDQPPNIWSLYTQYTCIWFTTQISAKYPWESVKYHWESVKYPKVSAKYPQVSLKCPQVPQQPSQDLRLNARETSSRARLETQSGKFQEDEGRGRGGDGQWGAWTGGMIWDCRDFQLVLGI